MSDIRKVAVIGAGVSGVSAAAHLKQAGLDVTVYERSGKAGGVWVYNDRIALESAFPSVLPSVGDSPEYAEYLSKFAADQIDGRHGVRDERQDSPMVDADDKIQAELALIHAPPGPCYVSLKNNVSTIEMELRTNKWLPGTEEFVSHNILAEYIQDTARVTNVEPVIQFNTRVDAVEKNGSHWSVRTSKLNPDRGSRLSISNEIFDAVVVASGHYHACNIPDTPGLRQWHQRWPDRIKHSKGYREPSGFEGQNVLLVGSGVSSWDIAKDIAPVANTIYQVSRGGAYDLPASLFPSNTIRIGDIASFGSIAEDTALSADGSLPGTVYLKSGHEICGIHRVILCTGYHMSYPFLPTLHADSINAEDADDRVLVTKDGQRTHNLHKDIFYIPDPTLAFIGVPYHVATFSLFEFQGIAVAAVHSGRSDLPAESEMREEYNKKTEEKGSGRAFHSLKGKNHEIEYVDELMEIVNQKEGASGQQRVEGHSQAWKEAYVRRVARLKEKLEQQPQIDGGHSLDSRLSESACT